MSAMRAKSIHRSPVQAVDITGNERRLGARLVSMQKVAENFTRGARRLLPFLVRRRARLVPGQVGPAVIAAEELPSGAFCQVFLEASGKSGWAALRIMNERLAKNDFFVGDYSIADIALFAYTHVADEGGFPLDGFPKIREWINRVTAQSGFISMRSPLS